jgi:glycosyltransferase involved in cell wall biosynthesis
MDRSSHEEFITVVIPTFNRATLLGAAIDSVANQTLCPGQVVVVDDGSTDQTQHLIESLKAKHPSLNIDLVYQANRGPAAARAVGLAHARGQWVAYLDADDVWLPEKLEWQLATLRANPDLAGVYCNFDEIDLSGEVIRPGRERRLQVPAIDGPGQHQLLLMGNFFYGSASGMMHKRQLHPECQWDTRLRLSEDWDFWLQATRHHSFGLVERPLVQIRNHGSNLQRDVAALSVYDTLLLKKWQMDLESCPQAKQHWRTVLLGRLRKLEESDPLAIDWWSKLQSEDRDFVLAFVQASLSTPGILASQTRLAARVLKDLLLEITRNLLFFRRLRRTTQSTNPPK